jgi:multidrug transporter EmrE-like cation transporter
MTNPNNDELALTPDEQRFIRKALAGVEKAERFQRYKQVLVTVIAFAFSFWLASRPSSPEMGVECVVLIGVGLMLAVCTSKILSLINKNTRAILQAISDQHRNV